MDARHQHRVWEAIADSFDATRGRTWDHVVEFVEALPPGRLLDVMAGNGRHTVVAEAAGQHAVALDWSRPLAESAAGRGAAAIAGDATRLPLAPATFDAAIYVAGLHGIPTAEGRTASLAELHRILRPGAPAQITVWSRDAPRFAGLDLPDGPAEVTVPWRAAGHDEQRYYFLYTAPALASALATAGFTAIDVRTVSLAGDSDNLVATANA